MVCPTYCFKHFLRGQKRLKDSCVVVYDLNDYIAEAEKQLNNKIVYKYVVFKINPSRSGQKKLQYFQKS